MKASSIRLNEDGANYLRDRFKADGDFLRQTLAAITGETVSPPALTERVLDDMDLLEAHNDDLRKRLQGLVPANGDVICSLRSQIQSLTADNAKLKAELETAKSAAKNFDAEVEKTAGKKAVALVARHGIRPKAIEGEELSQQAPRLSFSQLVASAQASKSK